MGGIAGVFSPEGGEVQTRLLERMTTVLRHRGPDDEGYVLVDTSSGRCEPRVGDDSAEELKGKMPRIAAPVDFPANLGLGYRRLSIVDLSVAGHQPMGNEDGTVWVVHNGEVYNFAALREELKSRGQRFRSNTDTEVVLHGYEEWGADCVNRFDGMWAFAIWDARERTLLCSRDRFGVKPLYYYFDGRRFLFASEIKAILEANFVVREPNGQAVFDFLVHWAEDCGEETFFSGIRRVPAGHYLEFRPHEEDLRCVCYYRVALENSLPGLRDEEYAERFRSLFEDSVRMCLGGDVPIGMCLSGGLDSSSIVCTIHKLARGGTRQWPGLRHPLPTFSARFDDGRYDEGRFINEVEKLASADATYVRLTGGTLLKELPAFIWHQEEPFIATSTYGKWEVFKLAHLSGSKACVDGQGGDELLAGYDKTSAVLFAHLLSTLQLPQLAREAWAHVRLRGRTGLEDLPRSTYHLLPRSVRPRVRAIMHTDGDSSLNKEFAAAFTGYPFRDEYVGEGRASLFDWHLYQIFAQVGLPSLLRHEDRNSMAHSVEYRAPFLDHRLVEFVLALPWDQKVRRGTRKFVLRNAMKGLLPEAVASRQDKIGLFTPEAAWLRGEVRELLAEVMNSASFRQRPYLDRGKAERALKDFQEGRQTRGVNIWGWLCLELWLRTFIDRANSPVV